MAKEKSFFSFKKHPVEDLDPVKELENLYAANPELTTDKNKHSTNDDNHSLKELIEKNRQKQKRRALVYFFIIFLSAVFSASAGFFYFSGHQKFEEESIVLNISGPEKIKINEAFDYTITYQNIGEYGLRGSRILIQYPQGFLLENSSPEIINHKVELNEIKPGKTGAITIHGRIIGEPNSEQKISASLYFSPSNFNAEFKKDANYSLLLETPDILPVLSIPNTVTLTNKFTLKAKIKNLSNIIFSEPRLKIDFPAGFTMQKAQPAPIENNNEWQIPTLEPQEDSLEIIIEGFFDSTLVFATDEERIKDFSIQLRLLGKENSYYSIKTEKFSTKIIDQSLNTYLIINGSTENKNFELGQNLNFSLIIKNNGQETYRQAEVKLIAESFPEELLNWGKISDKTFGKIQNNDSGKKEIIWDKNKVPALAEIKPNKEIVIDFSLPIKTKEELKDLGDEQIGQGKLNFFGQINAFDNNDAAINPQKTNEVLLKLLSNADLGVKALYYFTDGTPIGTGPLPFQVDQKTKLQIFWDISNSWHELINLTVKTDLPDYVQFSGEKNTGIGQIEYDSTTRQITWKIDRLPETVKEAHANFGIEITPRQKDLDQIIKLTGNSIFSATDQKTLENIIKTKNITTSALEKDDFANTSGLVEK